MPPPTLLSVEQQCSSSVDRTSLVPRVSPPLQTENIRIAYIDEIPPGTSSVSFKLNVVSLG